MYILYVTIEEKIPPYSIFSTWMQTLFQFLEGIILFIDERM